MLVGSEARAGTVAPTAKAMKHWGAVLRQLRHRALARLGWGLADQGVSSLTNVAVSFYLVHTLSATDFGAFSLAYVTYGFALNASRGLSTDPLMVRFSGAEVQVWRQAVAACTGTALGTGLITGVFAVTAGVFVGGITGAGFLALGLTLPGLMLQDSWRFSFFALGRGDYAFLNDIIWAATLAPSLVILRIVGHASVFWVVLAWGTSGTLAAAVGPLQARILPNLFCAWVWLVRHRDLGPRYLAEGVVSNSSAQLRSYGTGIILGLAAVGYLQAVVTLMGPTTIIFSATGLVLIPEAARLLRRRPDRVWLFCILCSAGMAALGIVWGLVLLIASPIGLGSLMLGAIWRPTYPLIFPAVVTIAATACNLGAGTGLHALGASRRSLHVTIFASAAVVGLSLLGAAKWGVTGTMWGTATAGWLTTAVSWFQLRAALRDAKIASPHGLATIRGFLPPWKRPPHPHGRRQPTTRSRTGSARSLNSERAAGRHRSATTQHSRRSASYARSRRATEGPAGDASEP